MPYVMRERQRPDLRHPHDRRAGEAEAGGAPACWTRPSSSPARRATWSRPASFTVEFIHVNHSIADAVAFAINTPGGHRGPHRRLQDRPHPHPGRHDRSGPAGRAGQQGRAGPAVRLHQRGAPGLHPERAGRRRQLRRACSSGCDERIIVTTFASNVDRIQQVINVAATLRPQGGRHAAAAWRTP